ncbi:TonB-dependent receptor [Sphingobium sp. AN558]|uniref:TonB-dependent receptor n=1 Tax=Sphingobium sp. AN558 TaxID=3133442 RepID=UPI0030BD24E1
MKPSFRAVMYLLFFSLLTCQFTMALAAPNAYQTIIVTGEKIDRSVHATPSSVAVTTDQSISDQGMTTLFDIVDRTPNLVADGNRTTFSIRGIDAFNVSGAGDGALATVYLDGAALPRLALSTGPLDLYDIAQVEIFRGPQSTVQGRNALAGAVIIRTADPTYDWTGRARVMMTGEDEGRRAGAALGGPLIDQEVAFRLAGELSRADGFIRNVTTGRSADPRASQTLRGKLLVTPRAVPGLHIVANFMHDDHRQGTFYTEFDPPFTPGDRISTADVADKKHVSTKIASLAIRQDVASGITLNSISSYGDILFRSVSDADRSAQIGQVSHIRDRTRNFQQEFRFNVTKERLDAVAGLFYLNERRDYNFQADQNLGLVRLGVDGQLRRLGLPQAAIDSVLGLYGGVVPVRNGLTQFTRTENYAAFADVTYRLGDRLSVRAALRYDREAQRLDAIQTASIYRSLPDATTIPFASLVPIVNQLNGLLRGLVSGANNVSPRRKVSYGALLPKLGVTYDVASGTAVSLMIQRGYRAGGSGLNQQRATAYDFGPEYTTNYELGLRSEWLNKRITINANVYRTDWQDQQVLIELTPGSAFDTQVGNIGRSRLYGLEVEAQGRISHWLSAYAGLGYSHTKFRDFAASKSLVQNIQGHEFSRAPRWTGSAGVHFVHPAGWTANLNLNWRSAYYQSVITQRERDIPGRLLAHAKIGWQGRHLGAFFTARNIFNVQKPNQFFDDVDGRRRGTLNDPRIFGLMLEGRL